MKILTPVSFSIIVFGRTITKIKDIISYQQMTSKQRRLDDITTVNIGMRSNFLGFHLIYVLCYASILFCTVQSRIQRIDKNVDNYNLDTQLLKKSLRTKLL